jgi:hypothetical protein
MSQKLAYLPKDPETHMIDTAARFKVNEREIVSNIIDGEAIVIDLARGVYHSLDQTGALAWSLLSAGHSVDECAGQIAEQFGVQASKVRDDLTGLVGGLVEQNLLVADPASQGPNAATLDWEACAEYCVPELNSYDDMGDILALDPPIPVTDQPSQ